MIERDVRFFLQRLSRGWDDSETFSLDHTLAKLIAPRLRRFREVTGTPGSFSEYADGHERWLAELDEMIEAFDFYASEEYFNCNDVEKLEDTYEGIQLFAKRFGGLWW